MSKPKPGQRVKQGKVVDFLLSKLQDDARDVQEAIDHLELQLADLGLQAGEVRAAMGQQDQLVHAAGLLVPLADVESVAAEGLKEVGGLRSTLDALMRGVTGAKVRAGMPAGAFSQRDEGEFYE